MTFQGQLPPQTPRQCAWVPCSRWFMPLPGRHGARYCPERDCRAQAVAKRLRDFHATHRGAGREPALAKDRPPHPFVVATDAAEQALRDGQPIAAIVADLRAQYGPTFAGVVRWALCAREIQRCGRPRERDRVLP